MAVRITAERLHKLVQAERAARRCLADAEGIARGQAGLAALGIVLEELADDHALQLEQLMAGWPPNLPLVPAAVLATCGRLNR